MVYIPFGVVLIILTRYYGYAGLLLRLQVGDGADVLIEGLDYNSIDRMVENVGLVLASGFLFVLAVRVGGILLS